MLTLFDRAKHYPTSFAPAPFPTPGLVIPAKAGILPQCQNPNRGCLKTCLRLEASDYSPRDGSVGLRLPEKGLILKGTALLDILVSVSPRAASLQKNSRRPRRRSQHVLATHTGFEERQTPRSKSPFLRGRLLLGLEKLGEQVVDEALGLCGVVSPKQVGVVKQVIQVVEVATQRVSIVYREMFVINREKTFAGVAE